MDDQSLATTLQTFKTHLTSIVTAMLSANEKERATARAVERVEDQAKEGKRRKEDKKRRKEEATRRAEVKELRQTEQKAEDDKQAKE